MAMLIDLRKFIAKRGNDSSLRLVVVVCENVFKEIMI